MKVCLLSSFRNSTEYLPRYFEQVTELHKALAKGRHKLTLILGEGDSTDGTLDALYKAAEASGIPCTLLDVTHGGGAYSSIADAQRFKQLAFVANELLAAIPDDADAVLMVESDLIWPVETMTTLLKRLKTYPAVSPMVMLRRKKWSVDAFYDTFIFRKDGIRFGHYPPYHACYRPDSPFQVDSAGSVMAIRGDLIKKLSFPDADVYVGFCRLAYEAGGSVHVDPTVSVFHL